MRLKRPTRPRGDMWCRAGRGSSTMSRLPPVVSAIAVPVSSSSVTCVNSVSACASPGLRNPGPDIRRNGLFAAYDQVAPDQVAPLQVAPDQVAPDHVAPDQVAPLHVAPLQVAPDQVAPDQVAPPHVAPNQGAPAAGAPEPAGPPR